jgi:hypothetical protein
MNKRQKRFLLQLADLCEKYNAEFNYTNNDDGIHITVDEEEIYVGYLSDDFTKDLREVAHKS